MYAAVCEGMKKDGGLDFKALEKLRIFSEKAGIGNAIAIIAIITVALGAYNIVFPFIKGQLELFADYQKTMQKKSASGDFMQFPEVAQTVKRIDKALMESRERDAKMDTLVNEIHNEFLVFVERFNKHLDLAEAQYKDTDVEKVLDINKQISDVLESVRVKFNADRAALYKIHNGSKDFVSETHYYYVSCYNETTRRGISHSYKNQQNIPVESLYFILSKLKGHFCVDYTTGNPKDYRGFEAVQDKHLRDIFKDQDTGIFIACPISNLNDQFVAFISISYMRNNNGYRSYGPELIHKFLRDKATWISGLLSVLKNNEYGPNF